MNRILLAVLLAVGACGTVPPTPPTGADCSSACARGRELGCTWSAPTAGGAACEEVCQANSLVVPWSVDCITSAQTCVAADACQ
jgi:hypothetical protein